MYSATRFFFPHGIEGEEMKCTFYDFHTVKKAIAYAHRYTSGLRFAGVQVEDESGNMLYEISSDGEVYDYRTEEEKK